MKFISFVNVRVAHQVKGCADGIMRYLYARQPDSPGPHFCNTLIISPPRCGKTTLLRDVIRQVSAGNAFAPGMTVGVVDERSELGACYQGVPQNDLGPRTDVLDCCPKDQGMMMLVRSMAPQVVAVDEIGSAGDVEAVGYIRAAAAPWPPRFTARRWKIFTANRPLDSWWRRACSSATSCWNRPRKMDGTCGFWTGMGGSWRDPWGGSARTRPHPQTVSHPNERPGERICC